MWESYAPKPPEYSPLLENLPDGYPSIQQQSLFFKDALLEGADIDKKPRLVAGPFYQDCITIMRATEIMLKDFNPDFTPEYLAPDSYRSSEVRQRVKDLCANEVLYQLGQKRLELSDALAKDKIIGATEGQVIAPGTLGITSYCQQHEEWGHADAERGCALACFRMIFGAITGWVPSESAVGNELVKRYGTAMVDDSVLSNLYQTEAFHELCDKEVVCFELIGADFGTISKLVAKIKHSQPTAEVYCVVNMASSGAVRTIWHAGVLLDVTSAGVLYHDPSGQYGGASKLVGRREFVQNWIAAYNRAQLIIAV